MNPLPPTLPSVLEDAYESPSQDRWLLSYADFMTLLLALFVVLYASELVESKEEASLFSGLQAAFFFDETSPAPLARPDSQRKIEPEVEGDIEPVTEEKIVPVPFLAQLQEQLTEVIEQQPQAPGQEPGVRLHQSERGLVVRLASSEFFPAGGVEIPADRQLILAAMAPYLTANTAPLEFEGHTDDQPVQGGPFPSNWELSTARAASVARFFISQHGLDPKRVATTGYAEFRPIVVGDGAAERAQNRRVEIVILEEGVVVSTEEGAEAKSELNRLLDGLPPIPANVDESLKPAEQGPPPKNIPLP